MVTPGSASVIEPWSGTGGPEQSGGKKSNHKNGRNFTRNGRVVNRGN